MNIPVAEIIHNWREETNGELEELVEMAYKRGYDDALSARPVTGRVAWEDQETK